MRYTTPIYLCPLTTNFLSPSDENEKSWVLNGQVVEWSRDMAGVCGVSPVIVSSIVITLNPRLIRNVFKLPQTMSKGPLNGYQ